MEFQCFGDWTCPDPVLVLLHEGLGCVDLWKQFPDQLAAATNAPVFSWSRAGYGRSDPADLPRPLDFMTREAVDVLPAILSHLEGRSFVLLGHSDGATIAAEFAGRLSDPRLLGLILLAPHFYAEPVGLAEIARAGHAFRTSDLAKRLAKYHRDPEHTFWGWHDVWRHPEFRHWHVGAVIDHWFVPALIIQGRQDQYGSLAQVAEARNRSPRPVDTLVLEGCRHAPHLEQPEPVVQAVAAFMQKVGPVGETV